MVRVLTKLTQRLFKELGLEKHCFYRHVQQLKEAEKDTQRVQHTGITYGEMLPTSGAYGSMTKGC